MVRKKISLCVTLMLMMVYLHAQQQTDTSAYKLTLQQCIDLALKNNIDVQHGQITSKINKVNWQTSKGNMFPTLNGDISHGINTGRSIDPFTNTYSNQSTNYANYSLNSNITVFNAFAIQNNIRQNKLAFEAGEFDVQNLRDIVALNVILDYLQVLTDEDLLSVSQQQMDVSGKQVERLDILNQEGSISPSQFYDLKGEYANNELNVVNAQNSLETAKLALAELLNVPYNKSQSFERVSLSDVAENLTSSDSIYHAALQNLAMVKAAELRKKSALYGVRTYRSMRYPTLYVGGGLFTNYSSNAATQQLINTTEVTTDNYVTVNGDKIPVIARQDNYSISKINYGSQFSNNFNTSLNVGIRIPLANNFQNRSQIKTALLRQQDAEITLNNTKIKLQQDVERAYVNMTLAKRRFDVQSEQVNAFKESFREAEIKFNSGTITSVDYLIVKNNLDQANLNLVIARYDYLLRSMILDYYSGRLRF